MRARRYRLLVLGSIGAAIAMACGLDLAGEVPDTFIDRQDGAPDVVDAGPVNRAAVDISAGYSVTCAAMTNGPPRCWGANDAGQLGSGIRSDGEQELAPSLLPRVVAMTEGATRISAGGFGDGNDERPVVCALGESGSVWCWGDDSYGQSGRGDAGPSPASVPARVVNLPQNIREVHVGGSHVCAGRNDGFELHCWGRSHVGQNQKITATPERTPSVVKTRAAIRSFALGNYHTCAILADETVDCWGFNLYGQLGHDGVGPEVDASVVPNVVNAQIVSTGHVHNCALHSGGKVTCWGHNNQLQLAREPRSLSLPPALVPLPNDAGAIDVCAGYIHSCAVLTDNTVACWGSNAWGQLGYGDDDAGDQSVPVTVTGVRGIVKITCGGYHTCALHGSGNVSCWGWNASGQLGRDGGLNPRQPVAAPVAF